MKIAQLDGSTIGEIADCTVLFPNTSFTKKGPDADWLSTNSCAEVITFLAFDAATQKNEGVTPYLSDGKVYTRRVTDMTSDERAAVVTANNAKTAANNRARRDALLAESDWMVIKSQETSTTLNADWATYRQALRDLPAHSNWPNLASASPDGSGDNDWPVKPS
tara:strand:+ start:178 stop:669 length:492 start_codon:yes stop_codon:yes gene_type:complete